MLNKTEININKHPTIAKKLNDKLDSYIQVRDKLSNNYKDRKWIRFLILIVCVLYLLFATRVFFLNQGTIELFIFLSGVLIFLLSWSSNRFFQNVKLKNWTISRRHQKRLIFYEFSLNLVLVFLVQTIIAVSMPEIVSYLIQISLFYLIFNGLLLAIFYIDFALVYNNSITFIGDISLRTALYGGAITFPLAFLIPNISSYLLPLFLFFLLVKDYLKPRPNRTNNIEIRTIMMLEPIKLKNYLLEKLKRIADEFHNTEALINFLAESLSKGKIGSLQLESGNISLRIGDTNTARKIWLKKIVLTLLIASIIKVIDAISEGLIQDLFLEDAKKFLCKFFNLC